MDLLNMKRRDLQTLCKKNNIPANMTNAAMTDALKSLETIEGVADILEQLKTEGSESPERFVITSSNVPQTSTRQKSSKEGLECSKMGTKTRYGTRKVAIEGADTRKTPATRTTRRRATQEASIQRKVEKDMQAKFEEDLDLSEVSENYGVESAKTSEEGQIPSGSQNEPEHEVNRNRNELVDVISSKENLGKDDIVTDSQEESIEKLDFHNLGRKDLQNLCKKNKIPANMTNVAMADALGSLIFVEGFEEFLKEYDPFAIKSPETSRMTSSRARQAHTERKSVRAVGSALCKSLSKKMEDLKMVDRKCPISINTDEGGLSVETNISLQSHLEARLEKPEFVDCVAQNKIDGKSNSVAEEISNKLDVSLDACGIRKELQIEVVENKSDERDIAIEIGEINGYFEANMNIESIVDKGLLPEAAKAEADRLGECIEKTGVTETLESESTSDAISSAEADVKGLIQQAPTLSQFSEHSHSLEADNGGVVEDINFEDDGFFEDINFENDESDVSEDDSKDDMEPTLEEDLIAPRAKGNDESDVSEDINTENDESDVSEDINPENDESDVSDDIITEDDESDVSEDESDVAEDVNTMEAVVAENINTLMKDDMDPTLEEDSDAPKAKGKVTPLGYKSLRKLKRLLREKLQEANLLAKKMEMLTLKDNEIGVDSNTDGINSTTIVASTLYNVEDEGHDDGGEAPIEKQSNEGTTFTFPITPVKSSRNTPKTPSKSSFKTPLSTGRTSSLLDANKENIDDSCSKTEPGKIKVVLTSGVVSLGKLKKEVKVLLQQSEKKRPPLQSRSDNQCALTSP